MKRRKKLKKENGSITLFVLIAMIIFLIIAFAVFFNINNKKTSQDDEIEKIQEDYSDDINYINEIYENEVENLNNNNSIESNQ